MQEADEIFSELEVVFERASEVREKRKRLKAEIESGAVLLSEVLEIARSDESVADTKLLSLMDCVPLLGKVRGRKLLEELRWAESVKLGELTSEQLRTLLDRLADHGCAV